RFRISPTSPYSREKFHPFLCEVPLKQGLNGINPQSCESTIDLKPPDDCNHAKTEDKSSRPTAKACPNLQKKDSTANGLLELEFESGRWPPKVPSIYGLCVEGVFNLNRKVWQETNREEVEKKYYCLRITVPELLFDRPDDAPYLVRQIGDKDSRNFAVVFGVV